MGETLKTIMDAGLTPVVLALGVWWVNRMVTKRDEQFDLMFKRLVGDGNGGSTGMMRELADDVAEARKEVGELSNSLSPLPAAVTGLQQQVTALSQRADRHRADINEVRDTLATLPCAQGACPPPFDAGAAGAQHG